MRNKHPMLSTDFNAFIPLLDEEFDEVSDESGVERCLAPSPYLHGDATTWSE
jgi:hypothetical protein